MPPLFALGASLPAQAQELKIGFLAPRTGIITQLGTDMVNGFQMYLDEHDGKLGGAKVNFIVEDDKGTVDGDVSMAKKLILNDKVDMIVGAVLGTAAYALAPVSNQEKTLFIGTITTADDIAQRQSDKFPYTVFSTWVSSQPTHALGQWACEQGYKRVSAIGTDYAFGYEQVGGFQKAFEDCGGKVVQKIWVPFGTKDFGPYIPGIKSDIDAIFSLMVGPMALQFPKQLRASGNKTIILGGSTNYDEFALPFMSDEVIGDVSAHIYSAALRRRQTKPSSRNTAPNTARCRRIIRKPITPPPCGSTRRWRSLMASIRARRVHQGDGDIKINPLRGPVRLDSRPRARSRTSTSRKSRRRRCSATTRMSSGTRCSRPTPTSAHIGNTTRRSSWRSRSTAAISRPANFANSSGIE